MATVPNVFANRSGSIPLNQLDADFAAFQSIVSATAGAGLVGFSAGNAYPAATVGGKLLKFISITDAPYLADPTGASDSTAAILAAYNAIATAGGGILHIPKGTFLVTPNVQEAPPTGSVWYAFVPKSNVTVGGDGASSVLKLADGSSDSGNKNPIMFRLADAAVSQIAFMDFAVDFNDANNPVNTSINNMSFFYAAGSIAGGAAMQVNHARFERLYLYDMSGSNPIIIDQYHVGATLSTDVCVDDCRFVNIGTGSGLGDASAVVLFADNSSVTNCKFLNADNATAVNIAACVELHGSNALMSDCTIANWYKGCIIAPNSTADTYNTRVVDNVMTGIGYSGVEIDVPDGSVQSVGHIFCDNDVTFSENGDFTNIPYRQAFMCYSALPVDDVVVTGKVRRISRTVPTIRSMGVTCPQLGTDLRATGIFTNLVVRDMIGFNLSLGVLWDNSAMKCQLQSICCERNKFHDLVDVAPGTSAAGIQLTGTMAYPLTRVTTNDNQITDDAGSPLTYYGLYFGDYISLLEYKNNQFYGIQTDEVFEGTNLVAHATKITRTVPNTAWTPTITFGGAGTGITYSAQLGSYWIEGTTLYFNLGVTMSNKGSSTGALLINGLPYAAVNTSGFSRAVSPFLLSMAAGVNCPMADVVTNSKTISVSNFAAGVRTGLADTDCNNTSSFFISGSYPLY